MLEKLMLRIRLICCDFFFRSVDKPASAISTSGDNGSNCGVDTVSLYQRYIGSWIPRKSGKNLPNCKVVFASTP